MFQKYLLCWFVVMFITLNRAEEFPPPEMKELIEALHETCTEKLGVSDDEVKNYNIEDKSKKMMCYMKCLLVESKWGKDDETIDYDYIIANIHPKIHDILLPALEKCREIADGEDCEKSYNFNACLAKADPAHYFLP